jgi:FtsP/CotA-like multicopper oxidase with cupredoxin domain
MHRSALARPAAGAVLLLAVVLALGVGARDGAGAQSAAGAGQAREFTLTAEPVRWEIQPGLVVDGWGYNGQVPGPTLRVTEGDRVRITLANHLPVPTTIHWHGLDVPLSMDGVPGLSQEPVPPGGTFTYEFTATNPGTRWYHSHVDSNLQLQLGLFGVLIIDPRQPEPEPFDREYTYILSEKALDVTPQVALGQGQVRNQEAGNGRGGAFTPDLFLMNGKAGAAIEPMHIAPGERIRIRLINAGNLVHAMHLHGHSFRIIATDGNPVPAAAQLLKDTVLIGPSERYDLAVEGTNPGVWLFHCHINNHMENGMVTLLQYDGAQPLAGGGLEAAHGAAGSHPTASPTPSPPPTADAGASAAPVRSTDEGTMDLVDNRFVPTRLTVAAGSTVTWSNHGNNAHTVTSFDGLWDSGTLLHDDQFSFTFTTPGTYRFICRQHLLQGMGGVITVEERPPPTP